MNQDDLARRIVDRLDQHLSELPADVVGRLDGARQRALRTRPTGRRWSVRVGDWLASHRLMVRVALPALFLLLTVGAIVLLQTEATPDPFDVETALLADELPIHAYTDPGFDEWLRQTSHEQQQ